MTIGVFGQEEEVISNPLSPTEIKNIVYTKCAKHDVRDAVLQQELVIHIGWLISNSPELFHGMLKFRIGYVTYLVFGAFVNEVDCTLKCRYQRCL